MPFTPAHPAIVLPFLRWRYVSATGLIAGSMAPDFEYFLKMSVDSIYSHTVAGLLYFDLPVVFFISCLFHLAVKKNLIYSLPVFLQRRFQTLLNFDFIKFLREHYWIFCISALAGAATHVLWDSFTHNNTYFVQTIPLYKSIHVPFDGVKYPLFYALQHISTWIGLTVVGIYIIALKPSPIEVHSIQKFLYWLTLVSIALVVTWVRFVVQPLNSDIGNAVVTFISGLLLGLVCCGLINFKTAKSTQRA